MGSFCLPCGFGRTGFLRDTMFAGRVRLDSGHTVPALRRRLINDGPQPRVRRQSICGLKGDEVVTLPRRITAAALDRTVPAG